MMAESTRITRGSKKNNPSSEGKENVDPKDAAEAIPVGKKQAVKRKSDVRRAQKRRLVRYNLMASSFLVTEYYFP